MIRKIGGGEFPLATDASIGESSYDLSVKGFYLLKLRKKKIEKAPEGFSVKIEHLWRNGRTKIECLSFEKFREKYLKEHVALFVEGAETLRFELGLNHNGSFIPITEHEDESFSVRFFRKHFGKIKDFKIFLYYDLYSA